MLQNVLDFFRNLPAKRCTNCGNEMEEQFDCYTHTCEDCQH